ncbi:hypothetical protein VCHA53O463_110105 [Vibrio chagasii]|nr:hypothetical protein VCHA35P150_20448 [Vibrio chagasii]CAH6906716.1 hypothetical protein VCHA56P515_100057 [Vibrio chagasii]CAH6967794.1 hypothetical protein VCHA53O463_110105 [Vibrio chagasii]CAH7385496.1 hypothetical protein VCHA53O464_20020 [Vibrio chagasii]
MYQIEEIETALNNARNAGAPPEDIAHLETLRSQADSARLGNADQQIEQSNQQAMQPTQNDIQYRNVPTQGAYSYAELQTAKELAQEAYNAGEAPLSDVIAINQIISRDYGSEQGLMAAIKSGFDSYVGGVQESLAERLSPTNRGTPAENNLFEPSEPVTQIFEGMTGSTLDNFLQTFIPEENRENIASSLRDRAADNFSSAGNYQPTVESYRDVNDPLKAFQYVAENIGQSLVPIAGSIATRGRTLPAMGATALNYESIVGTTLNEQVGERDVSRARVGAAVSSVLMGAQHTKALERLVGRKGVQEVLIQGGLANVGQHVAEQYGKTGEVSLDGADEAFVAGLATSGTISTVANRVYGASDRIAKAREASENTLIQTKESVLSNEANLSEAQREFGAGAIEGMRPSEIVELQSSTTSTAENDSRNRLYANLSQYADGVEISRPLTSDIADAGEGAKLLNRENNDNLTSARTRMLNEWFSDAPKDPATIGIVLQDAAEQVRTEGDIQFREAYDGARRLIRNDIEITDTNKKSIIDYLNMEKEKRAPLAERAEIDSLIMDIEQVRSMDQLNNMITTLNQNIQYGQINASASLDPIRRSVRNQFQDVASEISPEFRSIKERIDPEYQKFKKLKEQHEKWFGKKGDRRPTEVASQLLNQIDKGDLKTALSVIDSLNGDTNYLAKVILGHKFGNAEPTNAKIKSVLKSLNRNQDVFNLVFGSPEAQSMIRTLAVTANDIQRSQQSLNQSGTGNRLTPELVRRGSSLAGGAVGAVTGGGLVGGAVGGYVGDMIGNYINNAPTRAAAAELEAGRATPDQVDSNFTSEAFNPFDVEGRDRPMNELMTRAERQQAMEAISALQRELEQSLSGEGD